MIKIKLKLKFNVWVFEYLKIYFRSHRLIKRINANVLFKIPPKKDLSFQFKLGVETAARCFQIDTPLIKTVDTVW